jgi:hypothetical protein
MYVALGADVATYLTKAPSPSPYPKAVSTQIRVTWHFAPSASCFPPSAKCVERSGSHVARGTQFQARRTPHSAKTLSPGKTQGCLPEMLRIVLSEPQFIERCADFRVFPVVVLSP